MAQKERLRTPFTMARAPWPPFLCSPTRIPPLVHSVSIGEGLVAIAVIKRCIQQLPNVTILLTTTMATTFDVIEEKLPDGVIHQFTPLETPAVMDAFLDYWKPNAIMLDCRIAIGDNFSKKETVGVKDSQLQLTNRRVWMASSIHEGEEQGIHKALTQMYPDMLTIIVPRFQRQGHQIASALQREGLEAVLRSRKEKILPSTDVYVADTLGSLLPGLYGHNISEAAAAGCAVLTGHHIGHFTDMVLKMKQTNPLSVLQVSGKTDLLEALNELFSNTDALEARRLAAKQAFLALSSGVVDKYWNVFDIHVIRKAIPQDII